MHKTGVNHEDRVLAQGRVKKGRQMAVSPIPVPRHILLTHAAPTKPVAKPACVPSARSPVALRAKAVGVKPTFNAEQKTLAERSARALAWLHTARFLTTAALLEQLPVHDLPEIAFVGRSNAGKSTAINVLTQQKRLAFSSRTPGRTQHINLFHVGPKTAPNAVLVDLPGYGYAAVPMQDKLRWQRVMARYLSERDCLAGVVLMVDPRLGLTELDALLLDLLRERVAAGLPFLLLLTKADKVSRRQAQEVLQVTRLQAQGGTVQLFSALNRAGLDAAAVVLHAWVAA